MLDMPDFALFGDPTRLSPVVHVPAEPAIECNVVGQGPWRDAQRGIGEGGVLHLLGSWRLCPRRDVRCWSRLLLSQPVTTRK